MKHLSFSRRRLLRLTCAAALTGIFAPAVRYLPPGSGSEKAPHRLLLHARNRQSLTYDTG